MVRSSGHMRLNFRAFLIRIGASHRDFLQFLSSVQDCAVAETERGSCAVDTGRSLASPRCCLRNSPAFCTWRRSL